MRTRLVVPEDFEAVLAIYRVLSGDRPVIDGADGRSRFEAVLGCQGTRIFGAEHDRRIITKATLHVLPNMAYGGRPYRPIENVATLDNFQGCGAGRAVMQAAIDAAWAEDAYKIMLLSGRHRGAGGFYEKLGFNSDEKYGMVLRRP